MNAPALTEQTSPSSPLLLSTSLIGVVWLVALLWLTLTTANPVTLNRFQVVNSDFVVQGNFPANSRGFQVHQCWPLEQADGLIRFENRDEITPQPATDYLVPVVKLNGNYYITPSRMKGRPLIYPVSPDSLEQLDNLLTEAAVRQPSPLTPRD